MFIAIDKTSKVPMIRQIYTIIKNKILNGEVKSGAKLPSSRGLAKDLEVSRIVVLEAYEQLLAEGYLCTKKGSGTFVENLLTLGILNYQFSDKTLLEFDKNSIHEMRSSPKKGMIDIRTGAPDLSLFPIKKWGAIYKNVCIDTSIEKLDYYNPEGSYELRTSLLKYLNRSRGIVAQPQQVFITTGASQVFTLLSRLLLDKNQRVIVEDPINCDIYKMLISTRAQIVSIPVDKHGMQTQILPKDAKGKLIFTTPSHQFPMGGILSIKRRLDLIDYAKKSDGYILEDDYDSAFRFGGNPVSALHTLDNERVIYVGTFSKTLFPALRIGYVILPMELIAPFRRLKHLEDLHTPVLEQKTLARFIDQGLFEKHIAHCRKVYKTKNQALVAGIKKVFGDNATILGDSAGIHLVAKIDTICFNKETISKLNKMNLKVSPISAHTQHPDDYLHHIMIGYGHLSLAEINQCVNILAKLNDID